MAAAGGRTRKKAEASPSKNDKEEKDDKKARTEAAGRPDVTGASSSSVALATTIVPIVTPTAQTLIQDLGDPSGAVTVGTLQNMMQGIFTMMGNMTLQIQTDVSNQVEEMRTAIEQTREEVKEVTETVKETQGDLKALQLDVQQLEAAQSGCLTKEDVDKLIQEALKTADVQGDATRSGGTASSKSSRPGFKWVDRDNVPLPAEVVEKRQRTVIFSGFEADTKSKTISTFIEEQVSDFSDFIEGSPYIRFKWASKGNIRFKTNDDMKAFLTAWKEKAKHEPVNHNGRKISAYPDPGPVDSFRVRLLAVSKDMLIEKGVGADRIEFDKNMGVLMVDNTRVVVLKGDGMKAKVEVNNLNVEKLALDFGGPSLLLAIERSLRKE